MVFYRKYRPQTINDLDSEEVRKKLQSVLTTAAPTFTQIPHAFLFTGPKGLGKTSTARILAKVVNCVGRQVTIDNPQITKKSGDKNSSQVTVNNQLSAESIEPCNQCAQCVSITNGTNLDVFEIDAASNRGIDEIRDLKEKIRLAPVSAKKKVYIIDEVHMLTTEAFNALLKTLEEPPTHALFILCTTESHKIPSTILSRCFHIPFKRASEDELVRALKRIVKGENLKVDDTLLHTIAKLSDGGFRDGTKILEELVSLSGGKKIDAMLLENVYAVTSVSNKIAELLLALEAKDMQKGITIVSTLSDEGIDIPYFVSELITTLHGIFLRRVGLETDVAVASKLELEEIKSLLQLFSSASAEVKYAVIPSLPLELAVVTWCQNTLELRSKNSALSKSAQEAITKKVEEVTLATLRKKVGNLAKEKAVSGESDNDKKERMTPDSLGVSILDYTASGEQSQEWIDMLWKNIIAEMKQHNHMIAGVLRSCKIASYNKKVLTIEAAAKFHKERLEEAKTFEALQTVCAALVGNPIEIEIQLRQ